MVGAPCGVMDQMAAVLGQKSSLMSLQCQPAQVMPSRLANSCCPLLFTKFSCFVALNKVTLIMEIRCFREHKPLHHANLC